MAGPRPYKPRKKSLISVETTTHVRASDLPQFKKMPRQPSALPTDRRLPSGKQLPVWDHSKVVKDSKGPRPLIRSGE